MRRIELPHEVICMILALVPLESKKACSLASKKWRTLVLPLLFREINLYSSIRLRMHVPETPVMDNFIQTFYHMHEEAGAIAKPNRLDFRRCVRQLHVDCRMTLDQFEEFICAVLKLQNLEHLHWDISKFSSYVRSDYLLGFLQKIPKLGSLSLTLAKSDIILVVALTSLRELEIDLCMYQWTGTSSTSRGSPRRATRKAISIVRNDDLLSPLYGLVEIIRNARNVELLSLSLHENGEILEEDNWESGALFLALRSDRFPNLRTLLINSSRLWPHDSPLYKLIRNQVRIEKLVMSPRKYNGSRWEDADRLPCTFTPNFIEELMPSVRYFGGPLFMTQPLLESSLSKQLEILVLTYPKYEDLDTVSKLFPKTGNSTAHVPGLPRLRALGVFGTIDKSDLTSVINVRALCKLAHHVPMLEELVICDLYLNSKRVEELFQLLDQLPRLRRLAVFTTSSDGFSLLHERVRASFSRLEVVNSSQLISVLS
ncbi:hypothetical protein RHS02_05572, partial [Rhizoctonia solani]